MFETLIIIVTIAKIAFIAIAILAVWLAIKGTWSRSHKKLF